MDREAPYAAPAALRDARPPVILWYRLYAAVVALALLSFGVAEALESARSGSALPPIALDAHLAVLVIGGSAALAILHGLAAFVPYRPWAWTLGAVVLGLGAASLLVVVALPLLIGWWRPTTRAAFGRL